MPAQTNTKKATLLWPVSSSQKITGTDMMRPSVMKFGMLMIKRRPGRCVADDGAAREDPALSAWLSATGA